MASTRYSVINKTTACNGSRKKNKIIMVSKVLSACAYQKIIYASRNMIRLSPRPLIFIYQRLRLPRIQKNSADPHLQGDGSAVCTSLIRITIWTLDLVGWLLGA